MKILYYLVILPLSRLPFRVLYGLSDILYLALYVLAGYRKKVVFSNLRKSFPAKNDDEIREIAGKFYRHFCDLLIESIKLFSLTKEEAIHRCRVMNPEVIDAFARSGQAVVLVTGHLNNWELLGVAFRPQVVHQPIVFYRKLSNRFMDGVVKRSRERFGLKMLDKKKSGSVGTLGSEKIPTALCMVADQSPSKNQKPYWMTFLGQETAVMFGTEKYAKKDGTPVFYAHLTKVKRGFYECYFELITDDPQRVPYGYITQQHTKMLEADILKNPHVWLWTHKRWKRKRQESEELYADVDLKDKSA